MYMVNHIRHTYMYTDLGIMLMFGMCESKQSGCSSKHINFSLFLMQGSFWLLQALTIAAELRMAILYTLQSTTFHISSIITIYMYMYSIITIYMYICTV